MSKLIIFADDLTGALDTGVQFANRGIAAKVMLSDHISANDLTDPGVEVLAVDTDTRHDSAECAYGKLFRLTKEAMSQGVPYIYKKTDSALRGNVGAELVAVWKATGVKQMPFIPAYPDNNCITVNGCQMIDGVPLEASTVGADAFNAATYSRVGQIIRHQYDVPVVEATALQSDASSFSGVVVYDAASNADLRAIGKALHESDTLHICAGCAGFASVLSGLLGFSRTPAAIMGSSPQNILVISGSLNVNSIRQIDYLRRKGYAVVTLSDELDLSKLSADALNGLSERIIDLIREYGLAAVESINEKKPTPIFPENREPITAIIANIVKNVILQCRIDTLVVFGGDTCKGILSAMDCASLTPQYELLPGLVKSSAIINGREISLISKAGRFGGEDVLESVLR